MERTVLWYLLSGGRLIDTAHLYLNHRAIGLGIKEAIKRGIPREEIFVTTKVQPRQFGRNTTETEVEEFLEELGLEYIDLVLIHMPRTFPYSKHDLFLFRMSVSSILFPFLLNASSNRHPQ